MLDQVDHEVGAEGPAGGRLFLALAGFGLNMAKAVGDYLAPTIRDTLAGEFVGDSTGLAIVIRTLLTLDPGFTRRWVQRQGVHEPPDQEPDRPFTERNP